MEITLQPRKVTCFFGAAVAFLTLGNLFIQYCKFGLGHFTVYGLVPLMDVNKEANLPSLYSACSTLFCGVLLTIIAKAKWCEHARYRWHWAGLAALFLFLGVDEGAVLHEIMIVRIRESYHTSGALYFAWVIPYGIATIVIGIAYLRFILCELLAMTRVRFVVAGVAFIMGALVLEMAGARVSEMWGGDETCPLHAFYYSLEEFLEMAGILLFIHGLVCYIDTELGGLRIVVGAPAE